MSTRPDLSTITNILTKYVRNPSQGHINAAKRILQYLKGTPNKGISFSSSPNSQLETFIKFPIPPTSVTALSDANWGPQDQSQPNSSKHYLDLDLFKTLSISGFLIWGNGPIHWVSKRQSPTAQSSAEDEIVATDECTKFFLYLKNLSDDMTIYNDNVACIKWSKNMTTKGLRYIQI